MSCVITHPRYNLAYCGISLRARVDKQTAPVKGGVAHLQWDRINLNVACRLWRPLPKHLPPHPPDEVATEKVQIPHRGPENYGFETRRQIASLLTIVAQQ